MSPRRSRLGRRSARAADEKLRLVEKVIQGRDFTAMVETINASMPGSARLPDMFTPTSANRRSRRSILAHMIPLSAVWAGRNGTSISVRPLLFGKTEGSTPFRFSSCRRRRPHPVVGPTGAGKSVLLALMALQFRRYRRSLRSSPSISAARSAPPRSPWAATGTISAAG